MSIIPQDPRYPLDESLLLRSDEVPDIKVDNLVKLINANHCISKSMFKGGLTKLDVDRMRVQENVVAKRKQPATKQTATVGLDESHIMSLVVATMQPEISRIDTSVEQISKTVKDVASSQVMHKADFVAVVDAMLYNSKTK